MAALLRGAQNPWAGEGKTTPAFRAERQYLCSQTGCGRPSLSLYPIVPIRSKTMMVLSPIALKVAEAARPHLEKCIISTGQGVFKIGKAAFHLIYLPWGLLEMTVGAPFGKFRAGLKHTIRGGLFAPIRLFSYTLLLPLYMVGAEINI